MQLPPTITSDSAANQGLSVTLVDRVAARFSENPNVVSMLTVQYRMSVPIMQWSSDELCVITRGQPVHAPPPSSAISLLL